MRSPSAPERDREAAPHLAPLAVAPLARLLVISAETERLLAAQAERRGRPITPAEANIDVAELQREMEDGKRLLTEAIQAAQRQAVRRWNRGQHRGDLRVRTNRHMRKILSDLYDAGYRHGQAELGRAGYRGYARANPRKTRKLHELMTLLQAKLTSVNTRLLVTTTSLDLSILSNAAIARALSRVPGALDAASRMVSTSTYAGLGAAFDEASGAVDQVPVAAGQGGNGWEYTAVMDGATCDPCAEHDGETYPTWDDAQQVLPDGGPNPDCDGNGRCRCRLAPVPL